MAENGEPEQGRFITWRCGVADEYVLGTDGRARLNLQRAKIDTATSGAGNRLVTNTYSAALRVYQLYFTVASDTTVQFFSATTALTGTMTVKAGNDYVFQFSPVGWLETASGEDLNVTLGGGVQMSGSLVYAPRA
jgi:hypothetical protein